MENVLDSLCFVALVERDFHHCAAIFLEGSELTSQWHWASVVTIWLEAFKSLFVVRNADAILLESLAIWNYPECTKITRISLVVAAIFTAPRKNCAIL